MIKVVDKGSTFTKDNEGNIIKSTVKEITNDILLNDKIVIGFAGKRFIVGENGNYATDLNKADHFNTQILVHTLIALTSNTNYIRTNLILGLPIALYSNNKEKMKHLFAQTNEIIYINEIKKYIGIDKVEVFPEAAGAYFSQDKKDALIIDIGGLSVDAALFEDRKLVKYSTYSMGTMKLYSKIANYINAQYDLGLTEWDIQKIMTNGLYIHGVEQKLNLNSILQVHFLEIFERLSLEYDLKAIKNVILTGGGCLVLGEYFKRYIPQCNTIDPTFANAKGFYNVGKVIFNEQN